MNLQKNKKIIVSGGGTGGHIFPAISIANALKAKDSSIEILFVGAKGKMEMEKVPAAGYEIVGLPISGFQRKFSLSNFTFFFKLIISLQKAKKIIIDFKPDAVVGVGGFASGPLLRVATNRHIPALIQEQNSYPGVTNKILANKVDKICVAYDGMDKWFPKDKIIKTGNPVRQDLLKHICKRDEAFQYFELQGNRKTVLVVGGSLGARTINESISLSLDKIIENKLQVIWQTGKAYYEKAKADVKQTGYKAIKVVPFISRMDFAYCISDIIVSRAGASTISELCLIKKPAILVPSPNVAEDHQTKNAMALVNNNAAMMVTDAESRDTLVLEMINLLNDSFRRDIYVENIAKMAIVDSADIIADEILKLIENKK